MGELLRIYPKNNHPYGRSFEIKDYYNGPRRGTWYFRSAFTGELHGPFLDEDAATYARAVHLDNPPDDKYED